MSTLNASETPRTDAALENWDSGNKATEWARRLERELAEMEHELAGTKAEVKRLRDENAWLANNGREYCQMAIERHMANFGDKCWPNQQRYRDVLEQHLTRFDAARKEIDG